LARAQERETHCRRLVTQPWALMTLSHVPRVIYLSDDCYFTLFIIVKNRVKDLRFTLLPFYIYTLPFFPYTSEPKYFSPFCRDRLPFL
jgi:hypothetical protein